MSARPTSRAERLTKIEQLLLHHPEGMRVVEIAGACAVDRRTIYRDLAVLERRGTPLRQEDGRYSIIREQYLTTLRLDFHEVITLFLAARLLSSSTTWHNPHLVSALDRLGGALAQPLAAQAQAAADQARALPEDPAFTAVLEAAALAWFRRRKVRLWWPSTPGEEAGYLDLSPHFIEPTARGEMMLIGHAESSDEIQALDLRQVAQAQVLEEPAGEVAGLTPDRAALSTLPCLEEPCLSD